MAQAARHIASWRATQRLPNFVAMASSSGAANFGSSSSGGDGEPQRNAGGVPQFGANSSSGGLGSSGSSGGTGGLWGQYNRLLEANPVSCRAQTKQDKVS